MKNAKPMLRKRQKPLKDTFCRTLYMLHFPLVFSFKSLVIV